MENVIVFTSSYRIVETLEYFVNVRAIICEKSSHNLMLFNYSKWRKIPLSLVEKENEILEEIPEGIEWGISYGFGLIFKESTITKFQKGIWNIHTGKLPDYRGRHPITWAFLKGETKIGVTIHQIDKEIDVGKLLATGHVHREMNDGLNEIDSKIIFLLKNELIRTAIENFDKGKIRSIKKGEYLKPFFNGISIDSVNEINSSFLFNAVRAQSSYGGIRVEGKIYVDAYYYNDEFSKSLFGADIVKCKDGIKLALFKRKFGS